MSRVFFREELEGVATFWQIRRRDGVTLGFTSHDRDLWFGGIRHRAAPGMIPSAIRRTADFQVDSIEVAGALSHDAISAADLAAGRFDGARVAIGVVDWETLENAALYHGEIGSIGQEGSGFNAELRSAKADLVPRTSPTCRARFCGPGCTLSPARFSHEAVLAEVDLEENRVRFSDSPDAALFADGAVRWIDGPQAGLRMEVMAVEGEWLTLDLTLDSTLAPGMPAVLREGCDHTLASCGGRFGNAMNFQGEPFLPGNDMIARYPTSAS